MNSAADSKTRKLFVISLGAGLLIFCISAAASAGIGYMLDDWFHIVLARAMPHPFDPFFHDRMLGAFFRPVGIVWWWLAAKLGDPGPAVRHLAAALIQLVGAVMFGLAAKEWRNDDRVGMAAGLLCLSSPFAWACVGWLSCAYDLLALFFSGLALWRGLRYVRQGRTADCVLAGAATLAAMWSKESALVIPAVLFLLAISAEGGSRSRALKMALAAGIAVALAVMHRRLVLGYWMGGYVKGQKSFTLAQSAGALWRVLQEQLPGWYWRAAAIAAVIIMVLIRGKTRLSLLFSSAAAAIAALPALAIFSSPFMVTTMPARYFAMAAVMLGFPLALSVINGKKTANWGIVAVSILMVWGAATWVLGTKTMLARSQKEMAAVEKTILNIRQQPAGSQPIHVEYRTGVLGLDAAVKALRPDWRDRIVALNCNWPTHVVTPTEMAARLHLPWSDGTPRNPSQGFGLTWGEVIFPPERCMNP